MGFPSIWSLVVVPKPLVVLVLVLDKIKVLFSIPLLYFGLCSPDDLQLPPLSHAFAVPPLDGGAYRLSAADLPAPLPSPTPASVKRRLRVVQFGKLAAGPSSAGQPGAGEQQHVCAVCLRCLDARDEVRELGNCRHAFHRACIDRWVDQGQLTCPLCRARLLARRRERESWVSEAVSYLLGEVPPASRSG